MSNSRHTQRRIKQIYGRESTIIHPPVEVDGFRSDEPDDYFLAVTELVPHKRIELAAEAASEAGQRLKVVGRRPELPRLRKKFRKRMEFLGRVEDEELVELYAHARALVLPNVEEFGIAAVEAQAAGRPVIAAAAGGALETVQEGVTGQLVPPDDGTALKRTLRSFDPDEFDPGMIREHAENFSAQSFRARLHQEVREAVHDGPAEPTAPFAPPLFAASAGGHPDLLRAIAPDVVDGPEPVWVTSRPPRGERLQEDAEEVELLPEYGRSPGGALRNVLSAAWVVARRRPRTVVTSGAGAVAPFCVLARLAGAGLLFVETMARVCSPCMTARLLSRFAAVWSFNCPSSLRRSRTPRCAAPPCSRTSRTATRTPDRERSSLSGRTRSRTRGFSRSWAGRSRRGCSRVRYTRRSDRLPGP